MTVPDTDLVRVYDTCIPRDWLDKLEADLRKMDDPDQMVVVGGDFTSNANLMDAAFARYHMTAPWSRGPVHVVILPRPWMAGCARGSTWSTPTR